jgi:hypothetical protein
MSAVDTIKTLIALGVQVKDAVTKSGTSVSDFLASPEFSTIDASVTKLLTSLRPKNLQDAIDAIQKKEADLRAGRDLAALSTDELTQFHALLDAEDSLVNKLLTQPDRSSFLSALVNDVLPVLVQVAKVVIPLLT